MVTIGDVTAIVAFLSGLGLSSWALVVCAGLLMPERVDRARAALAFSLRACILRGLGLVAVPGIISFVLIVQPAPLGKLLGMAGLLCLLALAVVGTAGISRAAAEQIRSMQPDVSDYASFTRGAGFLIGGAMLPLLGWFLVAPLMLVAALGCGWFGNRVRPLTTVSADLA